MTISQLRLYDGAAADHPEAQLIGQVGTSRHFGGFAQFEVVEAESEIPARMDQILANLDGYRRASDEFGVADSLLNVIREFVNC